MNCKQTSRNERAVSPVIGVILMVAITVILSAVIGVFVLGLGDAVQETPPNAQWDVEWVDDNATITHVSGDTVDANRLWLVGPNGYEARFDDETNWGGGGWGSTIRAGATATTNASGGLDEGSYRIVWESNGASSVLKSFTKSR